MLYTKLYSIPLSILKCLVRTSVTANCNCDTCLAHGCLRCTQYRTSIIVHRQIKYSLPSGHFDVSTLVDKFGAHALVQLHCDEPGAVTHTSEKKKVRNSWGVIIEKSEPMCDDGCQRSPLRVPNPSHYPLTDKIRKKRQTPNPEPQIFSNSERWTRLIGWGPTSLRWRGEVRRQIFWVVLSSLPPPPHTHTQAKTT